MAHFLSSLEKNLFGRIVCQSSLEFIPTGLIVFLVLNIFKNYAHEHQVFEEEQQYGILRSAL